MSVRDIRLPEDLSPLATLLVSAFQYPENPAWSVQEDEQEYLVDAIHNLTRLWPLIKLAGLVSPQMRDILRGCVYQEGRRLVGAAIVMRQGSSANWIVSTVAVSPDARRRGIARQCVSRALEIVGENGGRRVTLSVIDGNLPAIRLYESLDFEAYGSETEYEAFPPTPPPAPGLPHTYRVAPLSLSDWRPSYELTRRTTPRSHATFEPIEERRFRRPIIMRPLLPLILRAQGRDEKRFVVSTADNEVVGIGGFGVPRPGRRGVSEIRLRLDSAHAELAPLLLARFLHHVVTARPGLRVGLMAPSYMPAIAAAALEAGFERRVTYRSMGMTL